MPRTQFVEAAVLTQLEVKRQEVTARKYAMEPLKAAIKREGRSCPWLMRQLHEQSNINVKKSLLYSYLNGYARIPRYVLNALCWIVSNPHSFAPGAVITAHDITSRVADEEVLLLPANSAKPRQQKKPRQRRKAS